MENRGRYIYGVVAGVKTVSLSSIGIEGNEVYTIPSGGFCAVVHSCHAEPYQSGDEETVKKWEEETKERGNGKQTRTRIYAGGS